ncbi:MAG TPA: DsrE family protein [Methylocystis sp.]|nr:DsrE family protein [Methylocystis sp.]
MKRRGVFKGAMLAAAGLFSSARAQAAEGGPMRVVYHLADFEKADFVLHNIRNHYEAAGGPEKVAIALVVHGPAVRAFAREASAATSERFAALLRRGFSPYICATALRGQNLEATDLAPGFVVVEAGVVRLAELQRDGYLYLRP